MALRPTGKVHHVSKSVAVIARFTALSEKRATLGALLKGMVGPTRAEAGCRQYDLYEVPETADFVLFERYRDQDALQVHRSTDHYTNYRAQLDPLLAEPISVSVLEPLDEA
jgi:quinol monooxygenase YgiN